MLKLNCSRHAISLHPISLSYKCKSAERAILGHTLLDSSILSQRNILLQNQKNQPPVQLQKKITELFQKDGESSASYPTLPRSQPKEPAYPDIFNTAPPRSHQLPKLSSTPNLRVKNHADSLACRPAPTADLSEPQLFTLEGDEEYDHKFLILLRRLISDEQLYVRALYTIERCFSKPLQQRYAMKRRKNIQKWRQLLGFQSQNIVSNLSLHGPLSSFADSAKSKMGKASRKIAHRTKDASNTCAESVSLDPVDVLERMFFYLPILIDLHNDFLAQLKRMLTTQPSIMQLLYVVNIMTKRFVVYKDIINHNYVKALADFETLMQTDKAFRRAVEECTEATDHLKLRALLQRTRHRVDYYIEMLEGLRAKHILPEATYTLAKADQCVNLLVEISQQTRQWTKLAEDTEKIALTASSLQGTSSFYQTTDDKPLISGNITLCKTSNPLMKRPMCAQLLADQLRLLDPASDNTCAEKQQVTMSLEQAKVYTCTHNTKSGPFHILVRTHSNDMLIELDTIGVFQKWRAQFKKVLTSLHGEHGKAYLHKVCELPLNT
ncbi:hypothetical protein BDF22DRAFT_674797 [Syncephalis plumigaleata]|nr:hypothetical protein BDF22DRAFT_674797 [Syncephalis plumigaleata]